MAFVAIKALPLPGGGMFALHVGTLALLMTVEAELFLGLGKHGAVLTGMDGVTTHTFSFLDGLMEPGRALELFGMAGEAEFVRWCGDADDSVGVNLVTTVAFAVLYRFVDNFL